MPSTSGIPTRLMTLERRRRRMMMTTVWRGRRSPLSGMRSCLPHCSTPRPTGWPAQRGSRGLPRSGESQTSQTLFTPETRVIIPAGLASGLSCHMRSCARPGCPWPWDEPLLKCPVLVLGCQGAGLAQRGPYMALKSVMWISSWISSVTTCWMSCTSHVAPLQGSPDVHFVPLQGRDCGSDSWPKTSCAVIGRAGLNPELIGSSLEPSRCYCIPVCLFPWVLSWSLCLYFWHK